MWDKIIFVLSRLGKFMFQLLKTEGARILEEIGPLCLEIVTQVETECAGTGCTGEQKFQKALAIALAKLPGFTLRHIRFSIESAVIIMSEDIDKDGVSDLWDKCPTDPNCK